MEQTVGLSEVKMRTSFEEQIKYSDEELVIVDNLREIPNMDNLRITFNIIAVCLRGKMEIDIAGESKLIHERQIAICHSHATLANCMVSPDFECNVLCIGDQLLRNILSSQILLWNQLLYSHRFVILDIAPQRLGIYEELRYQWQAEDSIFRREIITGLLRVALLQLCELLVKEKSSADDPVAVVECGTRIDSLFNRFLELVAKRKVKKIPVANYASELCITPKYLSTVCHTVSGKSPLKWISEYVIEDIIHYLKNTDLTAKEISDELGFPNASFFGKYVREHLGTTPNEYRKQLRLVPGAPKVT